jgi:hypothetical protein
VLSIDSASVTVLEGLLWRPFSRVGQAAFSLLCSKPEGKKQEEMKGRRRRRRRPNMIWRVPFL